MARVYSYHTFIFPFIWEMKGIGPDKEYTELKKIFDENSCWMNTNIGDVNDIKTKPDIIGDFDATKGFYKEYQYFYPYVRTSVYGSPENLCANYLLKGSRNNGTYHIVKDDMHYVLNINSIRVRLVNTGIGLFILECENYGKDAFGNLQCGIEVIKNINDYGRRITLPYITDGYSITADKLQIDIPGIGSYTDDFKKLANEIYEKKGDGIDLNYLCSFIKEILHFGSRYSFTSRPPVNREEICIRPVLDDRMYVAFAVEDKGFTDVLSALKSEKYAYISDEKLNKRLYEVAFMDHSGGCSCPDRNLREKLLDKAVYNRWLPWGTVYTMSAMGFGMVSSAEIGGESNHLYESFITCYTQMVYITLIQRASTVKFSRETADIARHFSAGGKKLSRSRIRDIMNLQERHSAFDSQFLFSEVSPEQQAIEMYDKLKDMFDLEEENAKIDEKLTSLYEITDTDLNIRVNTGVSVLTYVSIILSLAALAYSILFSSDVVERDPEYSVFTAGGLSPQVWIFIAITLVISLVALAIVKIHNRRK